MQYNKCPYCGANLDPCERCDCREKEKPSQRTAYEQYQDDVNKTIKWAVERLNTAGRR